MLEQTETPAERKKRDKRQYAAKWRAANREKTRAYGKEWRANNLEKERKRARDYARKWRTANPEKSRERVKRWCAANPEKARSMRRNTNLKYYYGITRGQWDALFTSQGRCCAICKAVEPGGHGRWHTDHCHTNGHVRGILCNGCNAAIGFMRDNPEYLEAGARYLRKYSTPAAPNQEH